MATELIPKIADIATLKGLSMLLALPMICVAYTFQTGLELVLGDTVFALFEQGDGAVKLIIIFTLKSLWVSIFTGMIYGFVYFVQTQIYFPFLYIVSIILIALALLGIFGKNKIPGIEGIEIFWFYSCIVWGIYLQTTVDEIKRQTS
jgi:uncharacterized membrane protein